VNQFGVVVSAAAIGGTALVLSQIVKLGYSAQRADARRELADQAAHVVVSKLRRRMAYDEARNIVAEGGWTPAHFPWQTAELRCVSRSDVCSLYPEAVSCSDNGILNCRFIFKNGADKKLVVVTIIGRDRELEIDNWWLE
jgi:hypothetical protein